MADPSAPTSWRDVYALVRDTRSDVLKSVEGVSGEVTTLRKRFDIHLIDHAAESGQRKGEARVLGFARSSVALVLSLISGVGVLAALSRG